jgi:hypothetical protein
MQREVYSWDGARRCTICDSVIVQSARRRTEKKRVATAWLIHHAAAGRFSPLGPQAHLLIKRHDKLRTSSVDGRFQSKPFLQCRLLGLEQKSYRSLGRANCAGAASLASAGAFFRNSEAAASCALDWRAEVLARPPVEAHRLMSFERAEPLGVRMRQRSVLFRGGWIGRPYFGECK